MLSTGVHPTHLLMHFRNDHNKDENTLRHLYSSTNNISWSKVHWEYSSFPYHLLRCSGEKQEARVLPDDRSISTTTATYQTINHTVMITKEGYDASVCCCCCCQAHLTPYTMRYEVKLRV